MVVDKMRNWVASRMHTDDKTVKLLFSFTCQSQLRPGGETVWCNYKMVVDCLVIESNPNTIVCKFLACNQAIHTDLYQHTHDSAHTELQLDFISPESTFFLRFNRTDNISASYKIYSVDPSINAIMNGGGSNNNNNTNNNTNNNNTGSTNNNNSNPANGTTTNATSTSTSTTSLPPLSSLTNGNTNTSNNGSSNNTSTTSTNTSTASTTTTTNTGVEGMQTVIYKPCYYLCEGI